MNTALLTQIADAIEAHPHEYNQMSFGLGGRGAGAARPLCGPYCVAGWAMKLSGYTAFDDILALRHQARVALGLTGGQSTRLFQGSWPVTWLARTGPPEVIYQDLTLISRMGCRITLAEVGDDKLCRPEDLFFFPTAQQAAPILRRIAHGDILL